MIIEVDTFKEEIPGYDPDRSEDFHSESGKLADKAFTKNLKDPTYKRIILMAGGTASGKSEYAQSYLTHKDQLVYDGTLKNFSGFEIKNQRITRYAKHNPQIKVVYILPNYWIQAFDVFLSRTRKMNPSTFFETHIKSAQTIAQILKETSCRVEVYASSYSKNQSKMKYERITFEDREEGSQILNQIAQNMIIQAKNRGVEIVI